MARPKHHEKMKKTTIELTEAQYFFLKKKVLALQTQNQSASIVSIIRDLIEKDRLQWTGVKDSQTKKKAEHTGKEQKCLATHNNS